MILSPVSQRATQMNLGARKALGDVLLFLHADTLLPATALECIESRLRNPGVVGGAFARCYNPASAFLNATCFLGEMRSRISGWFLGDQAMFVRREVFERLGGFRDYDLFEDLDFARRMRREGRVVTLRPPVISSARRFTEDGAIRKTLSDLWLTFRYRSGVHPNQLARELNGPLLPLPPEARSQHDATYRRAFPTLHCKDEPCPSVGRSGLTDDSHLPSERSSLRGS